jgi:ketosteroid isomerase-like protein
MKKILLFVLIIMTLQTNAQTNTDYLKEINRDIWLPFIEAYGSADPIKYKNLHTPDFIRGEGNGKRISDFKEHFNGASIWFDEIKKEGRKLEIAFRFTERFTNGHMASERGVYQLKYFDASGNEARISYGKFHVFLRKIKGVWKIVVDYDSNEKNTIDEKVYLAAFTLDDFEKY